MRNTARNIAASLGQSDVAYNIPAGRSPYMGVDGLVSGPPPERAWRRWRVTRQMGLDRGVRDAPGGRNEGRA